VNWSRLGLQVVGIALMSRGFWAVVAVLAVLGFLINNPAVAIGLGVIVVGLLAWIAVSAVRGERPEQLVTINHVRVPVRQIECAGCGQRGSLRIETRDLPSNRGIVQWPTKVCRHCRHEEENAGRVL
jgi:hypothetical protein